MAGHVTSCASHAASGNDYQKERQFKKINSQKDSIEVAMVRGGKQTVVKNTDVVVGDVLHTQKQPAAWACRLNCMCLAA